MQNIDYNIARFYKTTDSCDTSNILFSSEPGTGRGGTYFLYVGGGIKVRVWKQRMIKANRTIILRAGVSSCPDGTLELYRRSPELSV